jgi:hypothetical protein
MAGRMTVVAVRRTGHVLGAITAVAPGDPPSVASVAGSAMPVNIDSSSFAVPAAALAVADLGFDDRVFEDPQRARVLFPGGSDESASLAFVDGATHGQIDTSAGAVTASTLKVTTQPQITPTEDVPFWVLFQGPATDPPLIVNGVIPKTTSTSNPVAHGLTSGTQYTALVLVTGLSGHLQTITPP